MSNSNTKFFEIHHFYLKDLIISLVWTPDSIELFSASAFVFGTTLSTMKAYQRFIA